MDANELLEQSGKIGRGSSATTGVTIDGDASWIADKTFDEGMGTQSLGDEHDQRYLEMTGVCYDEMMMN
jgi:hypothetical protein